MAYVVIERHMCNSATCYIVTYYENIMACNKIEGWTHRSVKNSAHTQCVVGFLFP